MDDAHFVKWPNAPSTEYHLFQNPEVSPPKHLAAPWEVGHTDQAHQIADELPLSLGWAQTSLKTLATVQTIL